MVIALAIAAAVIVLLLVVIATRPAAFRIARSGQVSAAPDTAFAIINDFSQWPAWSPFEALDPAMTRTISTPSTASARPTRGPATPRPARAP